ncbi:MAG: DMT family transporter [Saprospiraceae bacterium]|nr:DMT family transporter [Saprospiraceae bacterium]
MQRKPFLNDQQLSWLILGLLALTWGSSYILIKRALVAFSAIQVASLRISISALAFLPLLLWRWRQIDWSRWRSLLIVGLAGSGIPAFCFALAQTRLSSSLTGVLSSLTPLFTLLLGILFFRVPFAWWKTVGVLVGLAGAVLLILKGSEGDPQLSEWWPGLLVVLATSMYALSSNVVKSRLQDLSSLTISSVAFFLIGLPGMAVLLATPFFEQLASQPEARTSLGYVAILSLAGTVMASIFFFKLVQLKDAIFASTVSYLIPLVALFWGVFDHEPVTYLHLLGMGLILAGVYLSRK